MALSFIEFSRKFLSVEGQIVALLMAGGRSAGEIYYNVAASQPTVSKKLARMVDVGEIIQVGSRADRRITTYILSPDYRQNLGVYSQFIMALVASDDAAALSLAASRA